MSTNGVAQVAINKNTENQMICAEPEGKKICIKKKDIKIMTQQWPKFSECREKANSYEKDYVTFMRLKPGNSHVVNLQKSYDEMMNSCSNNFYNSLK